MSIDAVGLLLYIAVVRAFNTYGLSLRLSSMIVVFVPFIFYKIEQYIMLRIYNRPLDELLIPADMITVFLQLLVAFFVFYALRESDDSVAKWLVIVAAGAVVNYMIIPYFVLLLIP